jgi:anti-sigma factor RsiW
MMNNQHILNLLEENSLRRLSEEEKLRLEAHTKSCADCRKAYQAALVVAELLRERASETLEPSPFFKSRVMAALREKRAAEQPWSFGAIWQMTRALVASMVAVVVLLVALSFFGEPATDTYQSSAADNLYSAERVIFEGGNADGLTDGEVLTTLYDSGK